MPVIGWAKPTPVDPHNFKNPVLDDILTSVAGPVSNFIVATAAAILLALISSRCSKRTNDRSRRTGWLCAFGDSAFVPAGLASL